MLWWDLWFLCVFDFDDDDADGGGGGDDDDGVGDCMKTKFSSFLCVS